MIRTIEEEDKVIRWAFAEIMGYLKEKHKRYWFKYNPKRVRVHKIMFTAFESSDIPVTRSWYRYGCFIHSTQLAGFRDFGSLKYRYLRSKYPPKRLQSDVAEMGFDVDFAIEKIRETIDVMPQKIDEYLKSLYEDAPEELGTMYTAKLGLSKALLLSNKLGFYYLPTFRKWFSKVCRELSVFHMSAFSHQFDDLIKIVMDFSSNVEEALLKIEEMIWQKKRILRRSLRVIHRFSEFFDEKVWLPFALEISARTVRGFREVQERTKQRQKKEEKMLESISALSMLSEMLVENNLVLSWDEYRNRISRSKKERVIIKAISEMERIYEESPERE